MKDMAPFAMSWVEKGQPASLSETDLNPPADHRCKLNQRIQSDIYGMTRIAKKTHLCRESLHRMLAKKGNPYYGIKS